MGWGMITKAQSTVAIASACKDCPATITALNCAISSAGILQEGTVVSSGVTQTIQATVSKTGNYTFTTTANGITFSASGTFTATGNQTVILTATGVPVAAGTTTFSLSYGGQSCTFDRVVTASGPKIAAIGPTNLRFKQLGIQWGLTLDGDVYGWNGALEGKTLGSTAEKINKSMTFTKLQNQPGKIAKISSTFHDQGAATYNMTELFMVGVDGAIYVVEPNSATLSGLYNLTGNPQYTSPANLTLIGNAGSGVIRTNVPVDMTYGDQKKVIRKYPASPSGQLWQDIAPLSEYYTFTTGQMYAVLGIDLAGRLFAATALANSITHNTTWKEMPKPAGTTASFQYVKFVNTDINEREFHAGQGGYYRSFVVEGNDGNYYVLNKQVITAVPHATAFANTIPKKIPLPTGAVLTNARFFDYGSNPLTECRAHLITSDGSMFIYSYSANTITEVTKPKPTTKFIDFHDDSNGSSAVLRGIALTNEGVYEYLPNYPVFGWKVNKQTFTTITPTAGLAGNWNSPRPENDYGTLFQKIEYYQVSYKGAVNYVDGDNRHQTRILMLDATGKAYYAIRTDFNYMHYPQVSEPGFFDGETGLYVTELLNGKYDDNNPYPEP